MRGGTDIAPFGLRVGETVRHRDFGEGSVKGVARGRIWFQWHGDSGITTGSNLEPLALHARLEITAPAARRILRAEVGGALANIEVAPCAALAAFQLAVNDVVRRADGALARIVGEFTFRAVVADLAGGRAVLAPLGELALVARPGASARRLVRDFARAVVEVDVGVEEGAAIVPGDRVLTGKGFATVVAAEGDALWIQADAATRLNAGVLKYRGPVKLVRRALAAREVAGCLPGDIVLARGKKWVAVDGGKAVELEQVAGGEVIPEEKIAEEAPVVAFRPDLPLSVDVTVRRGRKGAFSVSSADFKGKRVFPGDLIEVTGRQFTIAGYRDDAVWIRPVGRDGNLLALQGQALLDPDVVRIIALVDEGIKYTGQ
jgi:hypothetical protein